MLIHILCFPCPNANTHTVHMALMGYFIVFSFVTKPGQTLEFLLWGTIVPLNFLAGYYCSIVASTPQPTVYAFTHAYTGSMLHSKIDIKHSIQLCLLLLYRLFWVINYTNKQNLRNMISTIFGMWTLSGPAVRGQA